MRRAGFPLFAAWAALLSTSAWGLELSGATGLLQLPSTSYHYLAYDLRLAIGAFESPWVLNLGMTQPYSIAGYSELLFFGDVGKEWVAGKDHFVKPFVGLALGFYDDRVNSQDGLTPSIVMHGGLRLGSDHFGASLSGNVFLGIYDLGQVFSFTMWPMTSFLGAVYVAL